MSYGHIEYVIFTGELVIYEISYNEDTIDLSSRNITRITQLYNVNRIKKLDLNNNLIVSLPNLEPFRRLEIFDISNNKLTVLPNLVILKHIRELYAQGNDLIDLPNLNDLDNLQRLEISCNNCIFFPNYPIYLDNLYNHIYDNKPLEYFNTVPVWYNKLKNKRYKKLNTNYRTWIYASLNDPNKTLEINVDDPDIIRRIVISSRNMISDYSVEQHQQSVHEIMFLRGYDNELILKTVKTIC